MKPWKASVFQRRISSDIIEGEINHQRRMLGQGLLTTMPERRKEIKREKQIEDLAVQLARIASGPMKKESLGELIVAGGHIVTRQNDRTISVLHPGKKKARRYSLPKLLEEIEQAIQALDRSGPSLESGLGR